jgi:hypothetical protein
VAAALTTMASCSTDHEMTERDVPFPTVEHLERYWRNNPGEPVKACLVEMFAYL